MLPRRDTPVEPREPAGTAPVGLLLHNGTSAISALPRRNVSIRLPVPPTSTTCPPVEPELLRRVLDGLKKL